MARVRAYGSDATLLAEFEAIYGTPPAGEFYKLPFKSSGLGAARPLGVDPLLGQGRDAQDPFYEAVTVDGDIEVPVDLRNIGFWLQALLAAPVTVDNLDGTFTHTFKSGAELPSLSTQIGHPNLTTPIFLLYSGSKAGTMSFDLARSGPVNATINMIAQGEASSGADVDATPIELALQRFNNGSGSILVDDVAIGNITGGSLSFSNNIAPVETIRPDGLIDGADETEATAEGAVTVRFTSDTTLSSAADSETPVGLKYRFTIPGAEGYFIEFALPRVFLPKEKQAISGPGGVEATYNWRAAKDSTAGYMLQVTLKNDQAAY